MLQRVGNDGLPYPVGLDRRRERITVIAQLPGRKQRAGGVPGYTAEYGPRNNSLIGREKEGRGQRRRHDLACGNGRRGRDAKLPLNEYQIGVIHLPVLDLPDPAAREPAPDRAQVLRRSIPRADAEQQAQVAVYRAMEPEVLAVIARQPSRCGILSVCMYIDQAIAVFDEALIPRGVDEGDRLRAIKGAVGSLEFNSYFEVRPVYPSRGIGGPGKRQQRRGRRTARGLLEVAEDGQASPGDDGAVRKRDPVRRAAEALACRRRRRCRLPLVRRA